MVKETDSKSVGVSLAGSNPVRVALLFHLSDEIIGGILEAKELYSGFFDNKKHSLTHISSFNLLA